MMYKYHIYHKSWDEPIILKDNKFVRSNNDKGTYIMKDNLLILNWEQWDSEYFYQKNKNIYYLIDDSNFFNLDFTVSFIHIISNNNRLYRFKDIKLDYYRRLYLEKQ